MSHDNFFREQLKEIISWSKLTDNLHLDPVIYLKLMSTANAAEHTMPPTTGYASQYI